MRRADRLNRLGFVRRRGGKVDFESRPHAGLAADFDPALMLLDDAINGCESKASSFAHLFGGKERLKDSLQRIGIHAATGVRDGEDDKLARSRFGMLADVGLVNLGIGSADEQLTALGHGVPRVDRQVHHDLLEHAGVGFDGEKFPRIIRLQSYLLAQKPRQHFFHFAQHAVQIEDLGLNGLFAAEHEQLPGQRGGPAAGIRNLL